ncbi:MAG: START-like domain-containing protein [Bacteroidota bacterium]
MTRSPVTGETILEVTDHADDDEVEDQKALWDSQIEKLRTETGG